MHADPFRERRTNRDEKSFKKFLEVTRGEMISSNLFTIIFLFKKNHICVSLSSSACAFGVPALE